MLNIGFILVVKFLVFIFGRIIIFVFGSIIFFIFLFFFVSEGLFYQRMSLLVFCGWIMKCCFGCVCYYQLFFVYCEMVLKMQLVNDVKRWYLYCCQIIVIIVIINFDYIYNIINNYYLGEGYLKFCLKFVFKFFFINI